MSRFSRDSLAPRIVDRVGHALRPGWARSVLIRRSAAVVLVITAVVVGIAGQRGAQQGTVLVAARDLLPGHALRADDLATRRVPREIVPPGALRLSADGAGRMVVGRVRAGEIVTDTRLLSPRLPGQLTGRRDARLVPVRLAEDSVSSLLRAGDVVDVLTPESDVLARGAIVAADAPVAETSSRTARNASAPVLLAMDAGSAHRVAAAGLETALAVVLH
ncbi:SAF domain-containing protein [Gordonia sinesedis]